MSILPELYYLIVHMWYSFVNNLRHFWLFSGFHWLPRIQFNVVLCNHMTLKVKLSLICFNNIYVLGTVMDFRLIKKYQYCSRFNEKISVICQNQRFFMFLLIVCQYFVLQVLESANRNKLCCKRNKWTWNEIKKSTYGTNIVRNKCSTKSLSKLLTCILLTVKPGLQSYCDTSYSRGGVNQMWILKNSKDLLEYIQSRSLSSCNSIKIFAFSTLYTTIPHSRLKENQSCLSNCVS